MKIIVNGKDEKLEPCTIEELVTVKGVAKGALVVEHNRQIVPQDRWKDIDLKDGDQLELLSFVGGG